MADTQIHKLLEIARSIANVNDSDYGALEYMLHYLDELKYAIQDRKVDALVVETFGRRIEKLLQEKYVHVYSQIDDEKADSSNPMGDEESSIDDDTVRSLRASPINKTSKDRTSIEDFEIIKPISRGAFGRVFLARKRATGDLFAIKADMICKNAVERILSERNILISVRNPSVVEALAVKLTQKEGELIQGKFEVKRLANFLKQVPQLSKCHVQWYRASSDGCHKEAISGANKAIYAPKPFDIGRVLRAEVVSNSQIFTVSTTRLIEPGDGDDAAKKLFWQPRKGLSYVLTLESERERNAAIMVARKHALDCSVMLGGPDDQVMGFLLKVKRAKYVLDKSRRWMWKCRGTGTSNRKHHWLVEQKLLHFVDAFHQYVMDRVYHNAWCELCEGMYGSSRISG